MIKFALLSLLIAPQGWGQEQRPQRTAAQIIPADDSSRQFQRITDDQKIKAEKARVGVEKMRQKNKRDNPRNRSKKR